MIAGFGQGAGRRIRVLVIDDSVVVRGALKAILESDPGIETVDTAADPYQAAWRMERAAPDVIMLDIEMPRMDGITFLRKIMSQHPIPVVMCSSLAGDNREAVFSALESGAVDVIAKPRIGAAGFEDDSAMIIDSVKAASRERVRMIARRRERPPEKLTADAVIPAKPSPVALRATDRVVAVGASAGGTEALRVCLQGMPPDCPGIAIVQHMPERFTRAFAERLNAACAIEVVEARDGDALIRGRALIAPGNRHMILHRSGARYFVEIRNGPLVCRHRPSVDVLFRSASHCAGRNAVGVIMTGMGDDGARGLLEMRDAGAFTIAQDEATCAVFGMPHEAIRMNAAEAIVPLERIARKVLEVCG